MRRVLVLLVAALGLALALSAEEVIEKLDAYLKAGPWEALVEGRVQTPTGEPTEIRMRVYVLPKEKIARVEFLAPDSVADNFVVITPEKVYNYLFLTNQVIVYPRGRARIEGLGISLSKLGEFEDLGAEAGLTWKLLGEEKTEKGPAYKLLGLPEDPELAGFGKVELWVLKDPPVPYRYRVFDLEDEVVVDLYWKEFKRGKFTKKDLIAYPPDAEVIEK